MGVDFFLACFHCHEFIDLHKWSVVEGAGRFLVHAHYKPGQYEGQLRPEDSPYPLADLETLCKKVLITSDEIESAFDTENPDQPYIRELTPIVRQFAGVHRGHRLFISCDMGDSEQDPWWPGRPGFADWKEVPGVFRFHRFLPRNLIEIERLTSWAGVLDRLSKEWPFAYGSHAANEIEAIRLAFEECQTKRSP